MSDKCYLCGSTDGKCNHFPTPPASHDAGEALAPHNPWREFIESCDMGDNYFRSSEYMELLEYIDGKLATIATLTAEVARLTGELDAASARLHEVATLCATVEQERDRLTAELEEVREQRNRIAATMTGELEKEKAQSRHLAGAVSRKIDELIAAENQCGYFKMQYSRAEQVRKEACEANVKAQAAMLWLEADLERSRKECEALREDAMRYRWLRGEVEGPHVPMAQVVWKLHCVRDSSNWTNLADGQSLDEHIDAALSAGEKDGNA